MNIGQKVLNKLKEEISQNEYNRYIKNLEYDEKSSRSDIAIYTTNNILAAKWIKTRYAKKLSHLYEVVSGIKAEIIIDIKNSSSKQSKIKVKKQDNKNNSPKIQVLNITLYLFMVVLGLVKRTLCKL